MIAIALIALAVIAYFAARSRSVALVGGKTAKLHSRPVYHGFYAFFWTLLPALAVWLVASRIAAWFIESDLTATFASVIDALSGPQAQAFVNDVMTLASGGRIGFPDEQKTLAGAYVADLQCIAFWIVAALVLGTALVGLLYALSRLTATKRVRQSVETVVRYALIACSVVAVLTTVGIVFSLIFESIRFFGRVSVFDFLFGIHWSPQSAFEGAGASTSDDNSRVFGAIPLFAGTLLITLVAMSVAAPVGLMSAIYLSDYASIRLPQGGKARARNSGRCADSGLRLLRSAHRRACYSWMGRKHRPVRILGIGTGRRSCHGHHDHPLRVVSLRRCYQRRAAKPA